MIDDQEGYTRAGDSDFRQTEASFFAKPKRRLAAAHHAVMRLSFNSERAMFGLDSRAGGGL
jgi:hypothetical protein